MDFCPKCGSVLIEKKKNMGCPRCNYSAKGKTKLKTSEKIEEKKQIAVYTGKDKPTAPVVQEKCVNCGNGEAYFWTVQTRASDEAETKFYKCTKCGHTKRDYK